MNNQGGFPKLLGETPLLVNVAIEMALAAELSSEHKQLYFIPPLEAVEGQ